jgi:FMN reductase
MTQRDARPFVLGIGGTLRAGSSTECALAAALAGAERAGARTQLIPARELDLPLYAPERPGRTPAAARLIEALRRADGLVIASPGYHGGPSGLVKNALDYVEDLRDDVRPYLDGRAVGCVSCAYGWQATATTLVALRATVHALRGWPTPLGAAINSAEPVFADGEVVDPRVRSQLAVTGTQVTQFALRQRLAA